MTGLGGLALRPQVQHIHVMDVEGGGGVQKANIIKGPDILYLCIFIFYFSVSSSEDDEPNIAVSKHLEMPEGKH